MNLAQHLLRSATIHPDRPAIFLGDQLVATYRELGQRAGRLAGALTGGLGLRNGDRVGIVMKNTPEFIEVLYAAWYAGLIAVPVNPRLHPKETAYILENSGARACFATPELAHDIARVRGEIPSLERLIATGTAEYERLQRAETMHPVERLPADPAWLFYTSGTTGKPKGAVLSHRAMLMMCMGFYADFETVSVNDPLLHLGPMCHGSGLYLITRVACSAPQVIPASKSFDPSEVFSLIESRPNLSFFAAPTIVNRLVAAAEAGRVRADNLRTIIYGGAPMYLEDMKRALAAFGPKFAQVYGQGESPMAIAVLPRAFFDEPLHPAFEHRLAGVGMPQSVVEVRIAGSDGLPVEPGEMGEVLARGDTLMNGYWNNPGATASSLRDGWLHTGDVGVMDASGFITLKDRSKDVIISGGSNVYPREVEEVLLRHPAVAEVSVIGRRDQEWGEAVVAFVACAPGRSVTPTELDQLCIDNMARFKRPKEYRFIDSLPKSAIGKILKTDLRSMLVETAET